MTHRHAIALVALLGALGATTFGARAWDDAKYPNWKGEWASIVPRMPGARTAISEAEDS